MEKRTEINPANKKSKIVKTYLDNLLRLEHYPDRGYVFTFQIDVNKFFFVEYDQLAEVMDDAKEILRLKGGKKANGKK